MDNSQIIQAVSVLINAFGEPLFLAFTLMISFAVAIGFKRLLIE